MENEVFQQNKFEALGLQLKEKHGTITPVEQEKLGVLKTKMDSFWAQRMERTEVHPNLLEILIRNSQAAQATESQAPAQPQPIQAKSDTTGDLPDSSAEKRPNKTGMPNALKAGAESLSGYSLDNVRVNYNSPKPTRLQALAYTQGTEIHVAPGQEEHLPHEVWHVVQQAQGRVRPTMQIKGGVPVNNDVGLEQEADVMGVKALQMRHSEDTTRAMADKAGKAVQQAGETVSASQKQGKASGSSEKKGHWNSRYIGGAQKQEGSTAPAANHGSPIQLRPITLKDGRVIESRQHTKDELHEMFVSHMQTHLATAEQVDAAIDDGDFSPPTTVKVNPEIMDEGLELKDDLSRPPVHNEFHQNWQRRRDDPFNMKYPNWLPPLPSELKRSERNAYMQYRDDFYPVVKVFTGDTLHHFTTNEGADGIRQTGMMYPSVVAGMQTTHYGRGVYFTDLGAGGVESLRDKTHGDVTKSIYTRDSAENRRRSNNLAEVNVSDRLVLKYKLRDKDPVLMHPSTEPIDVMGRLKIAPTSDYVRPDVPPLAVVHSGAPKKARTLNPPPVPDKSLDEFYKQYKRKT